MTVNTPQGPLQATVGAGTTIQKSAPGTLEDLEAGVRVTVIGQRSEEGTILASSILMVPERFGDSPERGTFGR